MSIEQNKATARRFFEEAYNTGNVDILDEIIAADYLDHDPSDATPLMGVEGVKQLIQGFREAFADLQFTVEAQLAESDLVATRWTASATNTGPFMDMPASGKKINISGLNLARFVDGKEAETWNNWDTLGMMQQLGIIPTLGQ